MHDLSLPDHTMKQSRTIVEQATDDFLRHLRERNASPHTIKAYAGDLDIFAAYLGPRIGAHIKPTPQVAIASCCSSGGKVSIRMACDDGSIAAPAAPWISRKTTIWANEAAAPHSPDASTNNITDRRK